MGIRFLGLEFKAVGIEDHKFLQAFLRRFPQKISGYTFATLVAWAEPYGFEWAQLSEECLLISRPFGSEGHKQLLQPIGKFDVSALNRIIAGAANLPYRLQMLGVSRDFVDCHQDLMGQFAILDDRDAANYLHAAVDLAELRGRGFAKKRNLIAQFVELYPDWEMMQLSSHCGAECIDLLMGMARENATGDASSSVQCEIKALEFTMLHFQELEQSGVIIRQQGNLIGFSIFEPLSTDTVAVHFEKANRKFKGAFQFLNRETAKVIAASGFTVINREEDLGDEGLRHAKLSYHPTEIYPVYNLSLK